MSDTDAQSFHGVKVALLFENKILVIQRDDKPGLPFANLWDLPGGGRENNETPISCACREIEEELGILIPSKSIIWQKTFPSILKPGFKAYFMVAHIDTKTITSIHFGDEGQRWKLMDIQEFLEDSKIISHLKQRLQIYLNSLDSQIL